QHSPLAPCAGVGRDHFTNTDEQHSAIHFTQVCRVGGGQYHVGICTLCIINQSSLFSLQFAAQQPQTNEPHTQLLTGVRTSANEAPRPDHPCTTYSESRVDRARRCS